MLSDSAAEYALSEHLSSGRTLAECAAQWRQAYPADPFTVPEAEAFIQNVLRLRAEGIRPSLSVPMAIEDLHATKPQLKIEPQYKPAPKSAGRLSVLKRKPRGR